MESTEVVIKRVRYVVRRKGWDIIDLQEKGICCGVENSSFPLSYNHVDVSITLTIV